MSDSSNHIKLTQELIEFLKEQLEALNGKQELSVELLHELEEACLSAYEQLVKSRLLLELKGTTAQAEEEQLPNQLQMDFSAPITTEKLIKPNEPAQADEPAPTETKTFSNIQELRIGINDKFRFIKELFEESTQEYTIAINQINQIDQLDEALRYVDSLKNIYHWKDDDSCYLDFIHTINKKYV